jgi:hypothetical protein
MSPSVPETNNCNKEEGTILTPTADMQVHLLSTSLYDALPKNSITDVQVHRMFVLALAFAWHNSKSLKKLITSSSVLTNLSFTTKFLVEE